MYTLRVIFVVLDLRINFAVCFEVSFCNILHLSHTPVCSSD